MASYFDVKGIVFQYHSKSARQSPGEYTFSRLKLPVKVEYTFPDSIAIPDHL